MRSGRNSISTKLVLLSLLPARMMKIHSNKRINGPLNAHLIYGPTLSTKTSFANLTCCKIGQGQLRIIIYINCLELEFIMFHAKFDNHRTISSVGKDF